MGIGRLVTRTVIGGLFIGHGTQKLFGWFSGPGLQGSEQMMQSLQMHPPRQHALVAGATETAGGALLAAGAATPLAASGLIGMMISAIRKVHLRNGVWVANGGYEYNLVLIAALLALVDEGPGPLSVDALRGREHSGLLWALGALGLGVAASTVVIELGRRRAPQLEAQGAYPSEGDSAAVEATAGRPVAPDS
ncbi:MAG: DoxX family protein [Frankiaceae bacterium]